MKYDLYLTSKFYKSETLVKANCTPKGVQKEINKWCSDNNCKSYYTRQWEREDGSIMFDFGSHHIFFVLKPVGKEETQNAENK